MLAFVVASSGSFGREKAPTFEGHRVSEVFGGRVHAPEFGPLSQYSGSDLRCFGGESSDDVNYSVNFAGHFVIDECTCGSGCSYLYMWDALTGKVYHSAPLQPINVGPYPSRDGRSETTNSGAQYRRDSSLLILDGCFEDTCDCAKRYYSWNGARFKLIAREAALAPRGCKR